MNNLIKYDELEYKLCHVMLIDHTQTMLSMIFQYPILMPIGNRNINYIQLPIKDDDDVRLMFHSIAQISPSNTIEMYLQTHPRNHSFGLSPSFDHEIMGHDVKVPTKGNLAMHTDDMNENLVEHEEMGRGNLIVVTQSVMIATNDYVDISFTNEDDDVKFYDEDEINEKNYDDEPPTN